MRRTHAGSGDTLSDLGAEVLVEGDVAFFEDIVEKLGGWLAVVTITMW
jgi:hypothetical protein